LGRFGPYGILRVLGTGGMGVVFAARQERPRRLVALKMLLAGPHAGRQRLARFRTETEIVARLQHPNIVPIFEVGEHDGRPYFTMEHVDGGSLAQKLAAAPLPPREAAELVEALARAVQFAHERGFIHRDLKPSNVLLARGHKRPACEPDRKPTSEDACGYVPKIADFGLAKQFDSDDGTLVPGGQTVSGAILGTPAYMAPEQAAGGSAAVGPPADTYALGAILYECLTGRPPFRAATLLETLEQVRTQEPVPPGRLQPRLPRDLQTVCLKCLEKEPARRYASALALADDLGRFLRGEPIRARPASVRVRLAKWARRQPVQAALLAVSAVLLGALVAGALVYQSRLRAAVARAEAKEAEARRQQQRVAHNFGSARDALTRMLNRVGGPRLANVPRLRELRRDQLLDALAFYREVLNGEDNPDPAVRFDTAWAYMQTGSIQLELGQPEPAAANFRRAIALLEGLPAERQARPDCQERLAICWEYLSAQTADRAERERYLRQALAVRERLAEAEPDGPKWQEGLAQVEHNLGDLYLQSDRPKEAESHFRRAVDLRTPLVRQHPANEGTRLGLGGDWADLGHLHEVLRHAEEARSAFTRAEEYLGPLAKAHPEEHEYVLDLAAVYVNWGSLLRNTGQPKAARERATQAVDLAEAVLQREPHHATARQRAFAAHGTRAQVHEALRRWADAARDWDRVAELAEGPKVALYRALAAMAWARAGDHARAATHVDELAARPEATGDIQYSMATVCALSIRPARADAGLPSEKREQLAEQYGARAVALLRKLQASGYFKDPRRAGWPGKDPDLQVLRGRDDFKKLLADGEGGKGR
jgi:tetratricopeptide (TPR) repeat protein